mmetsp:Transcript_81490/g.128314  ORF Transcript_81490/g.128314 Transcript_81490/m.128314 type:complete len:105 (+) Transcript_81490:42-356(+)
MATCCTQIPIASLALCIDCHAHTVFLVDGPLLQDVGAIVIANLLRNMSFRFLAPSAEKCHPDCSIRSPAMFAGDEDLSLCGLLGGCSMWPVCVLMQSYWASHVC